MTQTKVVGTIDGLDETLKALDKFGAYGARNARKALLSTALEVRNTAIKSIQAGGSVGRTYEHSGNDGKPKRTHVASAPRNPPNKDLGGLVTSIGLPKAIPGGYIVGSSLAYAYYLEFGTRSIIERPWLRPAVQANMQYLQNAIQAAILDAIHNSGLDK